MQVLVTHWAADEYGWTLNEFGTSVDTDFITELAKYKDVADEKGLNFAVPLLLQCDLLP